jgi:hypothetical protein
LLSHFAAKLIGLFVAPAFDLVENVREQAFQPHF